MFIPRIRTISPLPFWICLFVFIWTAHKPCFSHPPCAVSFKLTFNCAYTFDILYFMRSFSLIAIAELYFTAFLSIAHTPQYFRPSRAIPADFAFVPSFSARQIRSCRYPSMVCAVMDNRPISCAPCKSPLTARWQTGLYYVLPVCQHPANSLSHSAPLIQ